MKYFEEKEVEECKGPEGPFVKECIALKVKGVAIDKYLKDAGITGDCEVLCTIEFPSRVVFYDRGFIYNRLHFSKVKQFCLRHEVGCVRPDMSLDEFKGLCFTQPFYN